MTAVELHKELVGDDSGIPLTRRTLIEGRLFLPGSDPTFDIKHEGLDVIVTTNYPDLPDAEWGSTKTTAILPEGGSEVIAQNRELRWRVVHKRKLIP